jgi:energy-coupling factor transporter ATP-binding protein EcfA2
MITKLTIESFKSLECVEVELGVVNVFIGANGSGKSNLLEAIGVLSAAAKGRVDDEALLRRGVRPGVPQLYKSAFTNRRQSPHIFFGASNGDANYEVSLLNPLRGPQAPWRYKFELWEFRGKKLASRAPRAMHKWNPEQGVAALKAANLRPNNPALVLLTSLQDFAIYSPNTPTLRGIGPDLQPRDPVGLSGGGLPLGVLDLLKARKRDSRLACASKDIRSMIDWAKGYGSAPSERMPLSPSVAASKQVVKFTDRFMSEGRNVLTGYDASEGALYVLFAAVLALHERAPEMLAIDNADHGLNPRLARRLMKHFCEWVLSRSKPRQVLLTTHNPLVLDGLPLRDDRVRLFTVSRTSTGRTVVNRVVVDKALLNKAQEEGALSRLWVMGHLGGVQNV